MEETVISERYEVLGTLGKGGMGVVLKCHDTILQRVVAVKVLGTSTSGTAIKRFQLEARAAAKLKQANILKVHDFGETSDGRLYLVMDFVEGVSLEQLLKERKALPIEEALPLFQQICKGTAHAHGQGVLHRDIKPSNIMLAETDPDWVKIVDFGIAKLNSEDQKLTSTGAIIGSPPYMAPEACLNKDVDARADIYSIGCLMFETLTGTPPYDGETAMAIVMMHTTEPIPRLSERSDQSLPSEIEKIVTICLAKNPGDRYQSVDALSADLDKLEKALLDEAEKEAELRRQEEEKVQADSSKERVPSTAKKSPTVAYIAIALVAVGFGVFATMNVAKIAMVSEPSPGKKAKKEKPQRNKQQAPPAFSLEEAMKEDEKYEKVLPGHEMKLVAEISPGGGRSVNGKGTDDEQVIKQFDEFKEFKTWRLSDSRIGLRAIKKLATSKVENLELKNTDIDDKCMEVIGGIKNLEFLQLGSCIKISPSGYKPLKNNKHLKTIQVSLPKDPGGAMEIVDTLGTLKSLTHLDIKGTMDGAMIKKVASFKPLDSIQMETPASDGWNEIKKLVRLQSIKLVVDEEDAVARSRAVQLLKEMPKLKTQFTHSGLVKINKDFDAELTEDAHMGQIPFD